MSSSRLYHSVTLNELPFVELLRERIFKFGRNSNNLVWRQEKLLNFFKMFEKSLDIYIENQNCSKGSKELFAAPDDKVKPTTNKDNKELRRR